jgi:hypothetical protein
MPNSKDQSTAWDMDGEIAAAWRLQGELQLRSLSAVTYLAATVGDGVGLAVLDEPKGGDGFCGRDGVCWFHR